VRLLCAPRLSPCGCYPVVTFDGCDFVSWRCCRARLRLQARRRAMTTTMSRIEEAMYVPRVFVVVVQFWVKPPPPPSPLHQLLFPLPQTVLQLPVSGTA
jgi:hypothetical protein